MAEKLPRPDSSGLIVGGMKDETITPLDRMLAERACERIIVDFIHRLDLGDPGAVAELFTPDGVWDWPFGDRRIVGREALRTYFASRPADRLSRRLMTNLLVTVESATTARAVSYLTTYRVDGYTGGMIEPRPPGERRPLRGHLPQRRRQLAPRRPDRLPPLRRRDAAGGVMPVPPCLCRVRGWRRRRRPWQGDGGRPAVGTGAGQGTRAPVLRCRSTGTSARTARICPARAQILSVDQIGSYMLGSGPRVPTSTYR